MLSAYYFASLRHGLGAAPRGTPAHMLRDAEISKSTLRLPGDGRSEGAHSRVSPEQCQSVRGSLTELRAGGLGGEQAGERASEWEQAGGESERVGAGGRAGGRGERESRRDGENKDRRETHFQATLVFVFFLFSSFQQLKLRCKKKPQVSLRAGWVCCPLPPVISHGLSQSLPVFPSAFPIPALQAYRRH